MATRTPRGFTLSLTLWCVCTLVGSAAVMFAVYYLQVPDARRSLVWTLLLIGIPAVVVSVLTGLVGSLGAHLGNRIAVGDASGAQTSRWGASVGAGLGAALIGALPTGYFLSILELFPGRIPIAAALPLAAVLLFAVAGGFTAVRWRQILPEA